MLRRFVYGRCPTEVKFDAKVAEENRSAAGIIAIGMYYLGAENGLKILPCIIIVP